MSLKLRFMEEVTFALLAIIVIASSCVLESSLVSKTPSSITFVTSNKTAEPVRRSLPSSRDKLITYRTEYRNNNGTEILQMSSIPDRTSHTVGFIQTVVHAYKNHHNLVLRPDDVWTAILVQFSFYVNSNAEELRSRLVNHPGQKTLTVQFPGRDLRSANYEYFVNRMSATVLNNVKPNMASWILPNFTTTTETDQIVGGVVLMATMQKYFSYRGQIMCGIPEITLVGTVQDWRDIFKRTQRLTEFGPLMVIWKRDLLTPILTKFIDAKLGVIDHGFWSDIVVLTKTSEGCGAAKNKMIGWLTAFAIFDNNGKWQGDVALGEQWPIVDVENFPSVVVTVPVTIVDHGKAYTAFLLAGHLGESIVGIDKGDTLQPYSGWGIALKNSSNTEDNVQLYT